MIKIDRINKYFFHGKPNQIHVIDNTSMELPDKGIVCFLGPSGCGKTTLLNAIGGLDKVNSGRIFVDGEQITGRSSDKIDAIRNAKIGYIFQNFYLLDDKTVFENVAIALRMIGMDDEDLISKRVRYCLDEVGIDQYRNKLANSLSGGQRQRVAIARAIVKNPSIIIADEPTGNLDSANTLEIMNIIRAISENRLVILVTHEQKIAEFYADHVAEISDGKIVKAYDNDASRFLDYQLENKIYLKDMAVQKEFSDENIRINVYSDELSQTDIKIVVKGGNLYINTEGRMNVVDETTNIELIDDHYRTIDNRSLREHSFEYDKYMPEGFNTKYTSIFKLSNLISKGWQTVKGFKKLKKILLMGFVFAAAFTFLATSNVFGIFNVQPKDYLTTNPNYITVVDNSKNDKLMKVIESLDYVDYAVPGDTKISVNLLMDDYLQTYGATASMDVSLAYTKILTGDDIIMGRLPQNEKEVVVDIQLIKTLLKNGSGAGTGISKTKQFIDREISVPNLSNYTIVGITDTQSPSLFADESQIMYILTNAHGQSSGNAGIFDSSGNSFSLNSVRDYALRDSSVKITSGSKPEKKYEVVLNESHKNEYKLDSTTMMTMASHKLKVVGFYSSNIYDDDTMYVNSSTIREDYISHQKNFTVYSENVKLVNKMLQDQKIASIINKDRDRETYIEKNKTSILSSLIVAGVILLISLIEMFLMLRSSFLSRIKEVGTLRAIGLKKGDIYKMFSGEILVITFITGIPGIALMYYIMSNVVKITDFIAGRYMIEPFIALIAFAVILLFNLLVGLLPVARTLRKTPAEILARTDI